VAYYQNGVPYAKIFGDPGGTVSTGLSSQQKKKFKELNNLHTLSFKTKFKHDYDDVYIAMCYPYTFTTCQKFVDSMARRDRI
jgi:hypothetical protein